MLDNLPFEQRGCARARSLSKEAYCSITLSALEALTSAGGDELIEALRGSNGIVLRRLWVEFSRLKLQRRSPQSPRCVCAQVQKLESESSPFRGRLRQDSLKTVSSVLPGGIYVGKG